MFILQLAAAMVVSVCWCTCLLCIVLVETHVFSFMVIVAYPCFIAAFLQRHFFLFL